MMTKYLIIVICLAIAGTSVLWSKAALFKQPSSQVVSREVKINPEITVIPVVTEASPTSKPIIYQPQLSGNQLKVPILLYHYIGENPNPSDLQRNSLSLSPTAFEEQMKYLSENGYSTISLDTLYAALKQQTTLSPKTVIITFDDGYMDFYYNAYPILRRFNLRATVFIPTGLMNQSYYLTWNQIREIYSSGLISFGAHSVHHYHLTSISDKLLEAELTDSKITLQNLLGLPINFIAYPYGSVDSRVINATIKAGFVGGVGTWTSKIQSEGTIYNLPRLRVGGGMTLPTFINLL